jgi:hypothetical protein
MTFAAIGGFISNGATRNTVVLLAPHAPPKNWYVNISMRTNGEAVERSFPVQHVWRGICCTVHPGRPIIGQQVVASSIQRQGETPHQGHYLASSSGEFGEDASLRAENEQANRINSFAERST